MSESQDNSQASPEHLSPSELDAPVAETRGVGFPVVGIGSSAGGLEAIIALFKAVPDNLGMAYVLVPHLDPLHESSFKEILARVTAMPVMEITEGVSVQPDRLYIIPPGFGLRIRNSVLSLHHREKHPHGTVAIDTFFRSLAADQQTNAIGVVLSGTGADGTTGLADIKAAGGITFAQRPETAKYDGMPASAIAANHVDYVLAPQAIAVQLSKIRNHPYLAGRSLNVDAETLADAVQGSWSKLFEVLRRQTKVDFSEYKRATIRRRVGRRMVLRQVATVEQYLAILQSNKKEVQALHQDLLINVTNFFRDPEAFESLTSIAYPSLLDSTLDQASPIRIWVPGCSTGEEAFSHAINLVEFLDHHRSNLGVQVFGTDLSADSIARARQGIFREGIEADVSPARLRRFFKKIEGGYQISKNIRDLCIFSQQNLATDPPFSRLDLVSCRNVMIYLGRSLQRHVIPILHYALNPEGFLMIGNSEGLLGSDSELFELIERKQKIYRKKIVAMPRTFGFSLRPQPTQVHESENVVSETKPLPANVPIDIQRESDRLLLTRYAPPSVVVDDQLQVIQIKGHTSPFLELPSGKVDLNILKMVRMGLLHDLQSAIEEARSTGVESERPTVYMGDGDNRAVRFRVIPFKTPVHQQTNFLITFDLMSEIPAAVPSASDSKPISEDERQLKDREIAQLRQGLGSTKEYLQAIIESEQATNEELQSANEEIQSGNEELQSTNEELQTSKEELESANEELHTVNEEMQHRNETLVQLNNDLNNLLNSVGLPVVIVGSDLSVRRFTPQAGQLLGLVGADIGRSFERLKLKLDFDGLERVMLDVLESFEPRQIQAKSPEGNVFPVRLTPYRTLDHRIDGVVLTVFTLDSSLMHQL